MHNCKATKARITEIALDGEAKPGEALAQELRGCTECREEFAALKQTLRMTDRSLTSAMPAETFWPGYHARLREKIDASTSQSTVHIVSPHSKFRRLFTGVVPVPVPVGLALMIAFGALLVFAIRAQQKTPTVPLAASVVRVPVEVPVIQEKIVTRIVYREPRVKQSRPRVNQSLASTKKNEPEVTSLVGFKPLDEVRLTVIKGGDQDEK